jgi:hypothetical protein
MERLSEAITLQQAANGQEPAEDYDDQGCIRSLVGMGRKATGQYIDNTGSFPWCGDAVTAWATTRPQDSERGHPTGRPGRATMTILPGSVVGQFWLWQSSTLENGRCARHIQGMEKLIALTVVIAIVVFVATYALSAWREHR